MVSNTNTNYKNIRPAVLMNMKDCLSATKPMGDIFECEHTKQDKRKIKSMVVQARHAMGNPVHMIKDYVLPLNPESPRPFNLQH